MVAKEVTQVGMRLMKFCAKHGICNGLQTMFSYMLIHSMRGIHNMEARMTIKAKPILKNKFWIVEKDGERIGTLSNKKTKDICIVVHQEQITLLILNHLIVLLEELVTTKSDYIRR